LCDLGAQVRNFLTVYCFEEGEYPEYDAYKHEQGEAYPEKNSEGIGRIEVRVVKCG
jgi:hypothetical protein